MNIRVDLNTPIKDGMEVVFRSPVDCSQITGLIVYYKGDGGSTSSKEFALADAHGNNVGDIDHLFAENVVVKVILDVTHGMAFVQNADTNAYLEGRFADVSVDDSTVSNKPWSSQNTIDKLCPVFQKEGAIVTCEPVAGSTVATFVYNGTSITRCGKNLFDFTQEPYKVSYVNTVGGTDERWGFAIYLPEGTYTMRAQEIKESQNEYYLFGTVMNADGTRKESCSLRSNTANYTRHITINTGDSIRLYNGEDAGKESAKTMFAKFNIQLEVGNTATDFEPYNAEIFVLGSEPGLYIHDFQAWPGVNTIWADTGEITVGGRSDPTAIINNLTNAILALGGNI